MNIKQPLQIISIMYSGNWFRTYFMLLTNNPEQSVKPFTLMTNPATMAAWISTTIPSNRDELHIQYTVV